MESNPQQKADAYTRKLLNKWAGGDASISEARVGHKILKIRVITANTHPKYLEITCGGCEYVCGPFRWLNASFELIEQADGHLTEYILRDEANGFSVRCGLVGAQEKTFT